MTLKLTFRRLFSVYSIFALVQHAVAAPHAAIANGEVGSADILSSASKMIRDAVTVDVLAARDPSSGSEPTCNRVVKFIAARGSYNPPGPGGLDAVSTPIIAALTAAGHGSVLRSVEYPATTVDPPYEDSVDAGAKFTQHMIRRFVDRCPEVNIVLLGYSQGAQVVLDATFGSIANWNTTKPLPQKYQDRVKAIMVMGDPSHYYQQTFVQGTVNANANGDLPRANNYECSPLTSKIVSFCDAGDPYCAGGNSEAIHDSYMARYLPQAISFVTTQLNAAGLNLPSSS